MCFFQHFWPSQNSYTFFHQTLFYFEVLIDAQVRTKSYAEALKTCKKIKPFNLHSMNCSDVYDSLELNGYKEFFPNSEYTRTIFIYFPTREQYRLEKSENEFEQGSIYDKFKIVGDISLLKCAIFKGLGDEEKCKEWSGFLAREPRISGQTGYDVT